MRSITLEQAALFASLAMMLLAGYHLADNLALIGSTPALVLFGSVVPSLVWAWFFFAVYRSSASHAVAWITLVLAVILEAVIALVRFQQSVNYWTPFGNALSLSGWLLRIGWAVFLILFARIPGQIWTRRIALLLAIVSAPSALSTAYGVFNNGIGFLFDEMPRQALWRVLITPVIRTIYWLSQILFWWSVWGEPLRRDPLDALSVRLTP
jgi:hypothetical protein